jgi:hypothetical protein
MQPCIHCPWRVENHGKRTPWGFYTKTNLRRLWNQVRNGGHMQSCHPTDPSHPDHGAAGAKPGFKPVECAGSVVLIIRELQKMQAWAGEGNAIESEHVTQYLRENRKAGITRAGLMYWLVGRAGGFARGTPFGAPELPEVDMSVNVSHGQGGS